MLRLWLRGPLAGELNGEPLVMPASDRARALIGWLALHPGLHPRTEVAARLWPDADPDRSRANLRTAIWAVRQAWGPNSPLVSTRSTLGLRDEELWTDLRDGPPVAATAEDLLAGIEDAWAEVARAEELQARAERLAVLADEADRENRLTDAVRWSEEVCRLRPLDEPAHRLLIERLMRAGDRAGAVVAARQFSDRLRSELGVRPSPATRAVQAQVRGTAPSAVRPALFGRARELQQLTGLWRDASSGHGRVAVLTGEAGIGKTCLIAELAHRVNVSGGLACIGTGLDLSEDTPFAVWLELAQALVVRVPRPPAEARWPVELNRLSVDLGGALGFGQQPSPVSPPELERLRLFEAVRRLVEYACAEAPVLIAIDDAHRADEVSLRLTMHIARRLSGLPVLVVFGCRSGAGRRRLDALAIEYLRAAVPLDDISVGPISEHDMVAVAGSVARLDTDQLRRVIDAAEGNPLLAVESARSVAAGRTGPPPNLRTAVRAIVGQLPSPAAELVRLLAVAGRPLRPAELRRLGPLADAALIDAATADGLLVREGGRLGFRHALLRDAAYNDLADPASWHDRLIGVLDGDDSAEIALHLRIAGRPLEAAQAWAAAAERARALGALTEAAAFGVRATELAPQDGRLWLELEDIWAWLGRRAEMMAAWDRAVELLPAEELAGAWARRGRQFRTVVCQPRASYQSYRQAQALLDAGTPRLGDAAAARLRAEVLIGLAWGDAVAGDGTTYENLLAQAEALLAEGPDPLTAADIAEIRMQGLIRQTRFADAVAVALPAGAAAEAAGLTDRCFGLWLNATCAMTCAGDYRGALELANRAVAGTEAVPVLVIGCLAARAHILSRLGRHEEALATVRRQQEIAARLDAPVLAATADHDAGLVALEAGRWEEAASLLGRALSGHAEVSRPSAQLARAEALARGGRADEATTALRQAATEPVGRADQPRALVPRIAWVQALIALARGDPILAGRRLDEAERGWQQLGSSAGTTTADGYLSNLVDLGRPPVVGLVEPAREIQRIADVRQTLPAWFQAEAPSGRR